MAASCPDTPLGRLAEALQAQPQAEELAKTLGVLSSVKRALDNGRRVALPSEPGRPRGLPLWMVVRTVANSDETAQECVAQRRDMAADRLRRGREAQHV